MSVQLGDKEFKDLADIGLGKGAVLFRSKVGLTPVQRSLLDKSFMDFEEQEVWTSRFGVLGGPPHLEDWFVLKVSRKGYQVLQEDPFRLALVLIDLRCFKYMSMVTWRLSKEELPVVLSCEDECARELGLRRLEELEGGDNK